MAFNYRKLATMLGYLERHIISTDRSPIKVSKDGGWDSFDRLDVENAQHIAESLAKEIDLSERVFQAVVYAYEGKEVPEDLLTHGMVKRALKFRKHEFIEKNTVSAKESPLELIRRKIDYYSVVHTAQCASQSDLRGRLLESCNCETGQALERLTHAMNNCEIHKTVENIQERTACAICFTEMMKGLGHTKVDVRKALDLEPIKKREFEATFGPWANHGNISTHTITQSIKPFKRIVGGEHDIRLHPPTTGVSPEMFTVGVIQYHDAQFIAEARTDIPALISEVEILRAEVQRLRELI